MFRCPRWSNLRAESDPRTAYVGVDQTWVLRVLKRVAAELDLLSGHQSPTDEAAGEGDSITAGVKRRRRFAEPDPDWSSLSQREQRAILREKIGFPRCNSDEITL